MAHWLTATGTALALLALVVTPIEARADATFDWMAKAYGDGRHNAFTDLVQWHGHYYLCFRHGETHNSMDGVIRVMRSTDMKRWEPCATLRTLGDDRDPHFTVAGDRLYVFFGVWDLVHWDGPRTPDRGSVRSHFASSADGEDWSEVRGVYEPGWWLWRVRHYDNVFYSAAYTAVRPRPTVRETLLLRSEDALHWDLAARVTNERMAGEADFWFEDDRMRLITRTGDKPGDAALFQSDPTLQQWERTDTGTLVHSPAVVRWKDRYFVSGRGRGDDGYVTKVWEMIGDRLEELITLPSGGDTGYSGLLLDPSTADADAPSLFVSWYSQHGRDEEPNATKNTASIYTARISVPNTK